MGMNFTGKLNVANYDNQIHNPLLAEKFLVI